MSARPGRTFFRAPERSSADSRKYVSIPLTSTYCRASRRSRETTRLSIRARSSSSSGNEDVQAEVAAPDARWDLVVCDEAEAEEEAAVEAVTALDELCEAADATASESFRRL